MTYMPKVPALENETNPIFINEKTRGWMIVDKTNYDDMKVARCTLPSWVHAGYDMNLQDIGYPGLANKNHYGYKLDFQSECSTLDRCKWYALMNIFRKNRLEKKGYLVTYNKGYLTKRVKRIVQNKYLLECLGINYSYYMQDKFGIPIYNSKGVHMAISGDFEQGMYIHPIMSTRIFHSVINGQYKLPTINNLFKRIYRDFCGQENLPMYSNFVSMKNKDDQPNLEDKLYQNQPDGSWMRVLKPDSELFK